MTKTMRKAYAEIDEILKYMPISYVEKVPMKFRRMFYDCKMDDYDVKIDPNKSLKEQKLIRETIVILAILKYNYWCNSEEEKKRLEQKFKENDIKSSELYDIAKLTSKKQDNIENSEIQSVPTKENTNNLPIKVENKSWFSKFISKIKSLFKR